MPSWIGFALAAIGPLQAREAPRPHTQEPAVAARAASADEGSAHDQYRLTLLDWEAALVRAEVENTSFDEVRSAFVRRFRWYSEEGVAGATWWLLRYPRALKDLPEAHQDPVVRFRARRAIWVRLVNQAVDAPWIAREGVLPALQTEVPERLGLEEALEISRRFEQRSSNAETRAQALYAESRLLAPWNTANTNRIERAVDVLSNLLERYPESSVAALAEDALWRLQNLSVGKPAPDFVAHDTFGNEIRLADFRGHVTLIRFWGFWNEDSRAQLDHTRELVQRLWDQRFVVVGINSDASRRDYLRRAEAEDVTWLNAFEGSTQGPVASAWHIREWPTTVLLDAEGVIRAINVEAASLDRAVDPLIRDVRARMANPLAPPEDDDNNPLSH